jgi:UDP-glucuronate 4-epimerase
MARTVLVTGGAGFIGSHVVERLLSQGHYVVCLDNFDETYPLALKRANMRSVSSHERFVLAQGDIRDRAFLEQAFSRHEFDAIVHLAALSGVRDSLAKAALYEEVNIRGTLNLLEEARAHNIERFVFASSSSVYGLNGKSPLEETQKLDSPISPYAASKIAGELLCHVFSYNYGFQTVALRFFTVYGPRQKPGMAVSLFATRIERGEEVPVFGDGTSVRDYTYVGDIVNGIEAALSYQGPPFEAFNLASGQEVSLNTLVSLIEKGLGKKARVRHLPAHPGDVRGGRGDTSKAKALLGYRPQVDIDRGIPLFVEWYRNARVAVEN